MALSPLPPQQLGWSPELEQAWSAAAISDPTGLHLLQQLEGVAAAGSFDKESLGGQAAASSGAVEASAQSRHDMAEVSAMSC